VDVEPQEPDLLCRSGHGGPWRYVEQIEVWREVLVVESSGLVVAPEWHTGEGFNEGVPGTGYLLCWHRTPHGKCAERVEIPEGFDIEWA
jgi:hypothetical protein